ncbi:citrate lyase subunit alpha / citrate CoA-transferase [Hathewaya proteolytica DSM 3090]|uniref:Citrate lyase alpha chain n=1 Tax=Hathewaya proteolytica DSM 3090 TaxID=1121331 RepID=A0A1M6PX48_9CLOT|nr:citrate lyase subunit alpha [Hathewaya proteolytica]SHK12500.1 citrate lyase subunit alpha / citrate CoA-transferase [Hathewaya proteolytica DSM 3090]
MKNILGRELPDFIEGYGKVKPFEGAFANLDQCEKRALKVKAVKPGDTKLFESLDTLLDKLALKDGMTIAFHHHLRNGDYVLNMVMEAIAKRGFKDITIAASSIFPVHAPLVKYMEEGVVTGLYAAYMSGPVAMAVSQGKLKKPAVMHTHGGRARLMESGDLHVDFAFLAAPTSDEYGNINGVNGPAACGSLGYAEADAEFADTVIAITDNVVPYPACPIEIYQHNVDYVLKVDSIGDPAGIVSGTTQVTKDPVGIKIAKMACEAMVASGLVKDNMSFQTGAGGISLAVAAELKDYMKANNIVGSFAAGGITGYMVDMLQEGLFRNIFDVQCFDLKAVQSVRENPKHMTMSSSMYGNAANKGAVVNKLDIMILGATEIDTNFNVNVTTASDGTIMGGSGGHSDTAAGSKLSIIVTKLVKSRTPIIKDRVTTVTTPGESVDMVVTEKGIAINPARKDLIEALKSTRLPVMTIEELKNIAEEMTGKPQDIKTSDEVVAVVEYRDGTVIDVIHKVL